ncbi:MAG TPA: phosphatase PAP2 family protein [Candidatus Nitrosocosmicus sp.]|jgi:undecaprenyl-diphosphatase|nr:phosphatase PAP2 family protein [Candidatus Nitrosocosmicus sp.]
MAIRPLRRWLRDPLRGAAALSTLTFLALAALAVHDYLGKVDQGVRHLVLHTHHDPVLGAGMGAITVLGDAPGLIPLIALVSAGAWFSNRRHALLIPLFMAGTGVLQLVAKRLIDRPRPNLEPWGFPSGHVLSLVVLLGLAAYVLSGSRARRRWRVLGAALAAAILIMVAASRLYLDMHWISDVLGGFTLGLAYLLAALLVLERGGGRRPVSEPGQEGSFAYMSWTSAPWKRATWLVGGRGSE